MSTLPFWQNLAPDEDLSAPYTDRFRVRFATHRLDLPLRVLPDDQQAVSSLLVNQASFRVMDALSENLAEIARSLAPDLIVGMPTLGLVLAATIARACRHERYVPLSTSRKFWYDERLSAPLSSITSPDKTKRLYLDPNLLPLLQVAKRIVIVDDVVSTGVSLEAGVRVLAEAGVSPCAALCVMTQSECWQGKFSFPVMSCFSSPLFQRSQGGWVEQDGP
ncbi:phosphoribosyltransferase [Gluconobacter frateurii]|uniref:Phosphoribosyltransferase n=1 Tax=Gluconobacter frateurii NRIC 0228 TaxID=1307946 RepID=A0ABQ0QET2_9PROT|nr:phosphoribosyltransferase [Gluconobacter frateurii]GBR16071.1 phosphoribosyltransferase [Gluconobacter frateurii NRIC 0228]GLP90475.1 phosphoribosyltransferase [Gluconobacter frateurii]